MPSGSPTGPRRAGRDWQVALGKWGLVITAPVAVITGIGWLLGGLAAAAIPAVIASGLGAVAATALLLAYLDGGWARINPPAAAKPEGPTLDERAEKLARDHPWKRWGLLLVCVAALGGLAWGIVARAVRGALVVKVGIFAALGIWIAVRAILKSGGGPDGRD